MLEMMKAAHFEQHGEPEVLRLKNVLKPKPREDEVMIRVVACGVNMEDILRRIGYRLWSYTNPILGHECSGYIVEKGSKVHNFQLFEEVCAIVRGGGAYGEYVTVAASTILHVPSSLSLVEAASLPQAMCVVFHCFHELRTITPSHKILINGAAGGVGVIAIQYAKYVGCEVFASLGTEENMAFCKELGAKECINHEKENLSKIVRAKTGDRGVDIILDLRSSSDGRLSFNYLTKLLDALAIGGTLFMVENEFNFNPYTDFSVMKKNGVEIIGACLSALWPVELSALLHQAEAIFWPLISNGKIRPVVGKRFAFSEAAEAHRTILKHNFVGKVVLIPDI